MQTITTFSKIYQTKYGDTINAFDPRYEAYKQALYLNNLSSIHTTPKVRDNKDGSYTVICSKVADITFALITEQ